jgi:hypothetical protein
MYNKICFLLKKFLSIFGWRRDRKQELLKQVNTYNESNLQLLMNSYAFIASAKKTKEEEINQYADSLNEALTKIFEPLCNREENRDAIS